LAVFVKDAVLFADETINHCTVSTVHYTDEMTDKINAKEMP